MSFEEKYSKAIQILRDNIDPSKDVARKKPLFDHVMRVGKYLHELKYSDEIVNAGLLHDVLEWTKYGEDDLRKDFGQKVVDIVKANTKDRSIEDPVLRRKKYIEQCIIVGPDALIVKAADALDSYYFLSSA